MSVILTDKIQPRTTGIALTVVGDTNVSGALTCTNFTASGDVSIGGTLTYEDVTNIDSVGLITARTGVRVTAGGVVVSAGTLTAAEGINVSAGIVTIADGATVNSTLTAAEGINVTAGVGTFAGDVSIAQNIIHTGDTDTKIYFSAADTISFNTGGSNVLNITSSGNLEMPNDNDYVKIGAGGDLQFVHTGSVSYISDATYPLELRSNLFRVASGVGTEAFRVDSDGRLLLGTTTEGNANADNLTVADSADSGITIRSGTSNSGSVFFSDGTSGNSEFRGYIQYQHNVNSLVLGANAQQHVDILSGGGVGIGASLYHLGDDNTQLDFGTDAISLKAGGSTRYYVDSSNPTWLRRDGAAGIHTSALLVNYTAGAGTGVALGFAPTQNYSVRYCSIEAVNQDGNNNMFMAFKTVDASDNAHGLERMRITSTGLVGMGEISPSSPLQVKGITSALGVTDYPQLTLQSATTSGDANTGSGIMFMGHDGNGGAFHATIRGLKENSTDGDRDSYLSFATRLNGQDLKERMRIDSQGILTLSNNQSTAKMIDCKTTYATGGNYIQLSDSSGNQKGYFGYGSTGNETLYIVQNESAIMNFYSNGASRMQIDASGNIGAPSGNNIYNASDERLKENMVELTDGLSKVKQLKPISFTWKDNFCESENGLTQYGFGAQTTQAVDELLVQPFGEGDIEFNDQVIKDPLRVNEKFIIPLLVKAIQEQQEQIETLKARLDAAGL